jgi:hypothetical protein
VLIALDFAFSRGPLQFVVLKLFGHPTTDGQKNHKEARRLCGRVAARIVGSIFLCMMFPPAFKTLRDPQLALDPLYAVNATSTTCIVLAAGYFLYDIFVCVLRYNENGPAFLLHGALCCAAYGYPILKGFLHRVGAQFLMWELSTPFLYLRWLLLKGNLGESKLMGIANIAFALSFFGCRIVYGPIMSRDFLRVTFAELADPRPNGIPVPVIYAYYTALLTLNCLNFYWFSEIVRSAMSSDKKKKTKEA